MLFKSAYPLSDSMSVFFNEIFLWYLPDQIFNDQRYYSANSEEFRETE